MVPISVVICCANSEDQLGPACESVKSWADELIIVDSGSQDRTAEVAQQYATKYVVEPWRGYSEQKKYGASLAKNDWVLILDGDEEVSPQLAAEFAALDPQQMGKWDVLEMPRRNWLCGRVVRAWWPDHQSRLINRHNVTWPKEVLHEARLPSHPSRLRRLRGWLEHKRMSNTHWEDYFSGKRADARIPMLARQMQERGKRCHWWDVVLRPSIAFFKSYILKGGFLDGTFGWLVAQKTAQGTQLKYAALWAAQHSPDKR